MMRAVLADGPYAGQVVLSLSDQALRNGVLVAEGGPFDPDVMQGLTDAQLAEIPTALYRWDGTLDEDGAHRMVRVDIG